MVSVLTLDERDVVIDRRTAKPGDEWVESDDAGRITAIDFGKGPDQTVETQCERLPDGSIRVLSHRVVPSDGGGSGRR